MTNGVSRRRFLAAAGAALPSAGVAGLPVGAQPTGETGDDSTGGQPSEEPDAIFRGDLQRRGVHPDAEIPDRVAVDWRIPGVNKTDYSAAKASAVVAPTGDAIIPGDTGTVYAITPAGATRWAAATDPSTSGIHGTPVLANGLAYVGAYDGALYAFDLADGERVWKAELADAIGSSPAYHDGTVYVAVEYGDPDGSLVAVDAATGEARWEATEPANHPHSTPALDPNADAVVVGSNDGYLYAWTLDGEPRWTFNTGRPIKGPVAIHDGAVFAGSWDHNVYRVGIDSGEAEWDRSFTADDKVMSGPAVDPRTNTVFVGSHDEHLHALDAETGKERWSYRTGGAITGCPTVAGDRVLVGSYDGYLYALDAESGEYVWDVAANGNVTSTPTVHDGAVYFAERASASASGGFYRVVGDDGTDA